MQDCQVHLCNGCAGYRLGVEQQEYFIDGLAIYLLQRSQSDAGGKRRNLVLQLRKFVGNIRGKEVESICPNLTKIGPSASSARRRRSPRARSSRRQNVAALTTGRTRRSRSWPRKNSSRPNRKATESILRRRRKRIYSICCETAARDFATGSSRCRITVYMPGLTAAFPPDLPESPQKVFSGCLHCFPV